VDVDVRDPVARAIARLPVPTPRARRPTRPSATSAGASARKPPHIKAPGKPTQLHLLRAFNAACSATTFAILRSPHRGVFHPPQGGELDKWNSYNRTVDNVLIEWDRKII